MRYKICTTIIVFLTAVLCSSVAADEKKTPTIEDRVCNMGAPTCPEGLSYRCTRHAFVVPGPDDRPGTTLAWSRNCGCAVAPVAKKSVWPQEDRVKFCYATLGEKWNWRAYASRHLVPIIDMWTWIKSAEPERQPTRADL